jgi:hypothetical protein
MNHFACTVLLASTILIAALIYALSNRYEPSPVNESFVIDTWTGNIYDLQGNNLSAIHRNLPYQEPNNEMKPDKIQ